MSAKVLWTLRSACFVVLMGTLPAFAGEPRDIVFDCPCRAEWVAGPGEEGTLKLEFGIRSHRGTDSGDIRLVVKNTAEGRWSGWSEAEMTSAASVEPVPAGVRLARRSRVIPLATPKPGDAIAILLLEKVGASGTGPRSGAEEAFWQDPEWWMHDVLVLWPMATRGDGRVEFVDILTDGDGDGVGDVNERLAGTSPVDETSRPEGSSTIDVLTLYNGGFQTEFGNVDTRIHHVMTVTGTLFADSGTGIRLRTVGMSQVTLEDDGRPVQSEREELLARHGADIELRFHGGEGFECGHAAGCATLGGAVARGYWHGDDLRAAVQANAGALTAAHELGHVLGLAHSDIQGETHGSFRWSRGHYIVPYVGTIMCYGATALGGVFSDPETDCLGTPCGVAVDEPAGANAVRSLDLVRWQAAAHRASKPDADGDGIVDPADALPDDSAEHLDSDGDGIGDNADGDDDNDGVADGEDAFPTDPAEWADADGDGIGDNADASVANLEPFRDPALRSAVEAALGKVPGESIAKEELETLTSLEAAAVGVRELAGLELAANLEVLGLDNNRVADLTPLGGLDKLREVWLSRNRVADLTPLADLSLEGLVINGNAISDLTPLVGMSGLRSLVVGSNPIADPNVLGALSALQYLSAGDLHISDVSFASRLTELVLLNLSGNPVADLRPLSDLELTTLNVGFTRVTLDDVVGLRNSWQLRDLDVSGLGLTVDDLEVLSELEQLETLRLRRNGIAELSPLAALHGLRSLDVGVNRVADLSPLGDLRGLSYLMLGSNRIADLSPLRALRGLRFLDVSENWISDLGPVVQREMWDLESHARLVAYRNPLGRRSLDEHVPKLEAWGIDVDASEVWEVSVAIPDPALRRLVTRAVAGGTVYVDEPITEATIQGLWRLDAFNAGVFDLGGLEAATRLHLVNLGSNAVSDLTPLGDLPELAVLDLTDNRISDLSPLVGNPAVGAGDSVVLDGNPLSEESLNVHVPALLSRGARVGLDSIRLRAPRDGGTVSYRVSGYFAARVGADAGLEAASGDPDIAAAAVAGNRLRLTPGAQAGTTTVTVAASGTEGRATLTFVVSFVERPSTLAAVPTVALGGAGDAVELGLADLFAGDGALTFVARSSDPSVVVVEVVEGALTIRSLANQGDEGVVTVTVTATDIGGLTGTLKFDVTVEAGQRGLAQRGWFRAWLERQRPQAQDAGG